MTEYCIQQYLIKMTHVLKKNIQAEQREARASVCSNLEGREKELSETKKHKEQLEQEK